MLTPRRTSRDGTRPPAVATSVTAENGRRRYRVLAYRPLAYAEVVQTIEMALARGWVAEPEPGCEAVIYTSIGIERRQGESSLAVSTPALPAKAPSTSEFARLAGLVDAPLSDAGH